MSYMKYAGEVRFTLMNGEYYIFTSEELSLMISEHLERI